MDPISLTAAISLWRLNEITGTEKGQPVEAYRTSLWQRAFNLNKNPKTNL